MAENPVWLSREEANVLREMVAWWKRRPANLSGRPDLVENDHQAADVYVALTPAGGISARSGTTPGEADCDIYKVIKEAGTPTLVPGGSSLFKTVYNHSSTAVDGSTYIAVARDKYGAWVALVSGGGGATSIAVRDSDTGGFEPEVSDMTMLTVDAYLSDYDDPDQITPGRVAEIKDGNIAISNATNASPIEITTSRHHCFATGDSVTVSGVGGNTAANGDFTVGTVGDLNNFELAGSTGNGAYTSGGTVRLTNETQAMLIFYPAAEGKEGLVSIEDQYLGAGVKTVERLALPSSPGSVLDSDAVFFYEDVDGFITIRSRVVNNGAMGLDMPGSNTDPSPGIRMGCGHSKNIQIFGISDGTIESLNFYMGEFDNFYFHNDDPSVTSTGAVLGTLVAQYVHAEAEYYCQGEAGQTQTAIFPDGELIFTGGILTGGTGGYAN